jgi:hypothetical protein
LILYHKFHLQKVIFFSTPHSLSLSFIFLITNSFLFYSFLFILILFYFILFYYMLYILYSLCILKLEYEFYVQEVIFFSRSFSLFFFILVGYSFILFFILFYTLCFMFVIHIETLTRILPSDSYILFSFLFFIFLF